MLMPRAVLPIILLFVGICLAIMPRDLESAGKARAIPNLSAPAGDRPAEINPNGATVLPSGRLITPAGVQVTVEPHPFGQALSPDGKTLVTANIGSWPFSLSVIRNLDSKHPTVDRIPRVAPLKDSGIESSTVNLGLAIANDNRTAYVSEGDSGRIDAYDLKLGQKSMVMAMDGEFNGKLYRASFSGALALSPDGTFLDALDTAHNELVVFDTRTGGLRRRVAVGRMPFEIAVSAKGDRIYVSNIGTYRYSIIPGFSAERAADTGLEFPPFAAGSLESEVGGTSKGKMIPGLGDPNALESNSVFVFETMKGAPTVTARVRTGAAFSAHSVGGGSGIAVGKTRVYVGNAAEDRVTVLNSANAGILSTIQLHPAPVAGLRGVLPLGLALSPDESRLYVACAGINAVAVVDTRRNAALGYIPTGWFPARVVVGNHGHTLYVANTKGFGAGPNGGARYLPSLSGHFIGDITPGTVSIIRVPTAAELAKMTAQVLRNNGFESAGPPAKRSPRFPIPTNGAPSQLIHHVVLIVKEGRSYDEVFGDLRTMQGLEVNGDPTLARWGVNADVRGEGQPDLYHVQVTPNHHALAERFGLSDNYYVDSDVALDGHRWIVDSYPTEWVETMWPQVYGAHPKQIYDNDAPGRLMLAGGPALLPEDYLEAGSLWDLLARHKQSFRNYGEGLSGEDDAGYKPTGLRLGVNFPLPAALLANTCRTYPKSNTFIPDQYRFEQFKKDFDDRYVRGLQPLPQFMVIALPNDRTAVPRPGDGYAYRASYVADNDLALGKIIELLSHTKSWPDMAVFVTEASDEDGRDHVDAHRSVLLVVSPYSRRGVSHVHTDTMSIFKTAERILGLPPLNQYDAAATDLSDSFTDIPDVTPYVAQPSDTSVFDPDKARDPLDAQ